MAEGLIMAGDIDCRSITEIKPRDLKRYTRVHLFSGISGWEKALQLAGWPDDRPVWTASCPCPPFSCAGKRKTCPQCQGTHPVCCPRRTGYFICCDCGHAWPADARHLWPEVWRLIAECRPAVVLGEQVSSEDGRIWLAGVCASLEILGFNFGTADSCSAGVGAPNIRQRLYWMAQSCDSVRRTESRDGDDGRDGQDVGRKEAHGLVGTCGEVLGWADSKLRRSEQCEPNERGLFESDSKSPSSGLASTDGDGRRTARPGQPGCQERHAEHGGGQDGLGQSEGARLQERIGQPGNAGQDLAASTGQGPEQASDVSGMDDARRQRDERRRDDGIMDGPPIEEQSQAQQRQRGRDADSNSKQVGRLDNSERERAIERRTSESCGDGSDHGISRPTGFWSDAIWHQCTDGKQRRIPAESVFQRVVDGISETVVDCRPESAFPLTERIKGRVAALKGFGNAINPEVAAVFIRSVMDVQGMRPH